MTIEGQPLTENIKKKKDATDKLKQGDRVHRNLSHRRFNAKHNELARYGVAMEENGHVVENGHVPEGAEATLP